MQYLSLTTPTEPKSEASYDIAIVGAGISSAHTLSHYISLLDRQSLPRPIRIVVTEKSGEFWTGIPYGDRSGCNSLLISSLKEFIPQQLEREQFVSWLNENQHWLFDSQKYQDSLLASNWLQANSRAIAQGMWDDLFIPRHTYGLYLKQRLADIIQEATSNGTIDIDLLTVEAIDIQRHDDLYRVEIASPSQECSFFTTKKLVLAIGSPPNVAFESPQAAGVMDRDICYIDNMYEPSVDFNIQRICRALQESHRPSHRQVLTIGSNAGTLDALYCLNNSKAAVSLIDKFIVLSPNAAFPHRISRELPQLNYSPEHLVALVATESFTAKQIFEAVQQDVACATAQQINISDIYNQISTAVIQALNLLSFNEQQQFVSTYAVEIGKLQRRAGAEYLDVVDRAIEQNKLEFISGRFSRYFSPTDASSGCEYIDSESQQLKTIDAPIGVIINCAGFQDVTRSSSRLIQNLIGRGICVANDSKRGFKIDRHFEASKNCYVMGPLVAGNLDGDLKVWHAESCQRIISLSKQLAAVLIRQEPQEIVTPVSPSTVENIEMAGVLVGT